MSAVIILASFEGSVLPPLCFHFSLIIFGFGQFMIHPFCACVYVHVHVLGKTEVEISSQSV